jgi:hypothetical protein
MQSKRLFMGQWSFRTIDREPGFLRCEVYSWDAPEVVTGRDSEEERAVEAEDLSSVHCGGTTT